MERYKVLELIGEGSFGRVFRASERDSGQTVALKLIPKVGHSDREISSLRTEFKIQKELSHPNIVRLLDGFETEKELISVAEYIPGELYRLFDQYKLEMGYRRLPEERVQEICGDLLSALHYLHSHRILHRDIKPQNILLDSEGRAKLCDFGFARNLGINTFVLTSIKGTPLYMAPELIEEKPYDHTADIWSVGCIVYELLTGHPPFSTSSLFQLIRKIRYESIQWPAHLSADGRSFLQGVLEKESKKRLTWPQLAEHSFVKGRVKTEVDKENLPLTEILSESQELAKEIQRQDKSKLLPGNSQTLIRVAQKHELEKQKLAVLQRTHNLPPSRSKAHKGGRRYSDIGQGSAGMLLGRHNPSLLNRRMSEVILPSMHQAQYLQPLQPIPNNLQPYSNHGAMVPPPTNNLAGTPNPYFAAMANHAGMYTGGQPGMVQNQYNANMRLPTLNGGVSSAQRMVMAPPLFVGGVVNSQYADMTAKTGQYPDMQPRTVNNTELRPRTVNMRRNSSDTSHQNTSRPQPVRPILQSNKNQAECEEMKIPLQFVSDLPAKDLHRPVAQYERPPGSHQGQEHQELASCHCEDQDKVGTDRPCHEEQDSILAGRYCVDVGKQDTVLADHVCLEDSLRNLSLDSNETIKNSEAQDTVMTETGVEWFKFMDDQIQQALMEAEETKTLSFTETSTTLYMILCPLESLDKTREALEKMVQMLMIPFLCLTPDTQEMDRYVEILSSRKVPGRLTQCLSNQDDADILSLLLNFLLRLTFVSEIVTKEISSSVSPDLFPKLLTRDDILLKKDTLALVLKLLPVMKEASTPSAADLVDVLEETDDSELQQQSLVCLLALKKMFPNVDTSNIIKKALFKSKLKPLLKEMRMQNVPE